MSDGLPSETTTWLTPAEIAAHLRISKMTVYRLIQTMDLPATKIGRSYRVRRSDLDNFLAKQ